MFDAGPLIPPESTSGESTAPGHQRSGSRAAAAVRPAASSARPVLANLTRATQSLSRAIDEELWRLQTDELGAVLDQLDTLRRDTERLLVATTAEATVRGAPDEEGASSATDYLVSHCPSLDTVGANHVVKVATALRDHRHRPLADAVAAGAVPVRKAMRMLQALAQIEPFVSTEEYIADQQIILPLAIDGSDKDLRKAVAHLIEVARPERDNDAFEEAQRRNRGMYERAAGGNMTEFVWRLDPEGAAYLRAAIGPLSRPQPDADGPDPRSPQQRRSDALLAIIKRGMTSPGAAPTTDKAKVIVTLSWEQLIGEASGLGRTMTGEQLRPRTIRRLACDAALIPAVLGSDGEVLDLGRTARLASPAQRQALWLEQEHCTWAGCTIPAQWCDVHHATWWSRGGRTDKDNLRLLCQRHHTRVHDHDLQPVEQPDGSTAWQP